MKIQCPECQYEAVVPEEKIPASGITASCPKCKTRFKVERKQSPPAQKSHLYCPKCGMRQPQGDICIKCGVVFSKFMCAQKKKSEQIAKEQKSAQVPEEPAPSQDDGQSKDNSTNMGETERPLLKKQLSKNDKRNLWVLGFLSFGLLGALNWFAPLSFWVFTSYFLYKKGGNRRNSIGLGCGVAFLIVFILGPLTSDFKKTPKSDHQQKVAARKDVVVAEPQKPLPVRAETVNAEKVAVDLDVDLDVDLETLQYFTNETAVKLMVYLNASFECLRYLFFKEYSIDRSLIDGSIELYENEKENLIEYSREINEYRDNIDFAGSYLDFIVAYDDIFSSAKRILSEERSPDKELILAAARKILHDAKECSESLDESLLDDDSRESYEVLLKDFKYFAADIKAMEIYLDPNRTRDDTQIVVGQYGFNEHYIEYLTDSEKESFIISFDFDYRYNIEYYRNIKGVRFITYVGEKSDDLVPVSSKAMLYDGTIQNWSEMYYCGMNQYRHSYLSVSNLAFNQIGAPVGPQEAPQDLGLFQKMIYGVVCD